MSATVQLMHDHVRRFNEGVRTGDFGPMLAGFAEDAELEFEGVPVGPFSGRDAIAAAYRDQPPDDEVLLLDAVAREGGVVIGGYAWRRRPTVRAGEIRLTPREGRIGRLVVTFDEPDG